MKIYYVNGWREGKWYFFGVGHFTTDDVKRMESGEVISKDGKEFRIEVTDDE